ncbi:hypothetical protein SAY87_024004 [Trapa incisa]|uniref:Uncharacterized protein n=1 Tax=Trapa incisa TaxID=236973 RepID=A0AAN7QUS9_9MYRT|nr:hypothetical protein SAY87_024004 [Trapa incisa]
MRGSKIYIMNEELRGGVKYPLINPFWVLWKMGDFSLSWDRLLTCAISGFAQKSVLSICILGTQNDRLLFLFSFCMRQELSLMHCHTVAFLGSSVESPMINSCSKSMENSIFCYLVYIYHNLLLRFEIFMNIYCLPRLQEKGSLNLVIFRSFLSNGQLA